MLALLQKHNIGSIAINNNVNNNFYNLKSYSSHSSDSDEILNYKRQRRQELQEKNEEISKRKEVERKQLQLEVDVVRLQNRIKELEASEFKLLLDRKKHQQVTDDLTDVRRQLREANEENERLNKLMRIGNEIDPFADRKDETIGEQQWKAAGALVNDMR